MASAVVRDTIQQRSCHLGIAKHRDPICELEVCGDDDAGRFIQLADQMKQECPAGLWKRDIAKLVDDHAVQGGQLLDDFPGVSVGLLCDQGIDQIDGVIELRIPRACGQSFHEDVATDSTACGHPVEMICEAL